MSDSDVGRLDGASGRPYHAYTLIALMSRDADELCGAGEARAAGRDDQGSVAGVIAFEVWLPVNSHPRAL
jgi:hypothetical protein